MSIALERRCFIRWLAMPVVIELSVFIGVGGCRCPISIRAVRRPHASVPLWKVPASSASAAELTTFLRMTDTGRTTPLLGGSGS